MTARETSESGVLNTLAVLIDADCILMGLYNINVLKRNARDVTVLRVLELDLQVSHKQSVKIIPEKTFFSMNRKQRQIACELTWQPKLVLIAVQFLNVIFSISTGS